MTDTLVMVNGFDQLFTVVGGSGNYLKLASFFQQYTPNGGSEYLELWAEKSTTLQVPYGILSVPIVSHTFKETQQVIYVGKQPMKINRLKDVTLTVAAVHLKDIACIADGCTHWEFFYPWELQADLEF